MSKRALVLLLTLAVPVSFVACGGGKDEDALLEEEATPVPAAAAPAVTGKVSFAGTAPTMEKIKMEADAFCKSAHATPVYSQEVVVNPNNTLQWVFVYVKEGVTGTYPAPTTPVTIDQQGCQYHPHIFGIQAGQPLRILNSDSTLHNIHALPKKNPEFNIGQPFKGMETIKKFDTVEMPVRFVP